MRPKAAPAAPEPAPQLVTPKALRQRWVVSNMWLWRARRDGKLPFLKLGHRVRYRLADVEKYEASLRA